jgi:hypothetical protein
MLERLTHGGASLSVGPLVRRALLYCATGVLFWACKSEPSPRRDAAQALPAQPPALAAPSDPGAPRSGKGTGSEPDADEPAAAPHPAERLAPGGNDEFDAAALADVKHALSAVEESAFAPLVHKDKRVLPDNCRSWQTLRKRGYAPNPKNPLAEQRNAGALVRCGAYEFLARAKPSRVSHVRKALEGAGPNDLPAIVASATSKLALRARSVAVSKGLSLGEFLPSARVGRAELRGRVLFDEPASATSVIVNAEVWGDVNSDEIEDLLLSVLNSSEDLGYFEMRLIEVTRLAAGAPLTVLAVSE